MKIYKDESLSNFEWWSGAVATADRIWEEQGSEGFDQLEAILEDLYPDGIDETDLNDLLWFDADTVYEWLGIDDKEEDDDEDEDDEEEGVAEKATSKELKMERYKVVYEGFIFEGDSDGLNIRYAERYSDVSWMLVAYDGVEIIDTYYDI